MSELPPEPDWNKIDADAALWRRREALNMDLEQAQQEMASVAAKRPPKVPKRAPGRRSRDWRAQMPEAIRVLRPYEDRFDRPHRAYELVQRFGGGGSLKIDYGKGTFYDFRAGHGGGTLELIRYTLGLDSLAQAAVWFETVIALPPAE